MVRFFLPVWPAIAQTDPKKGQVKMAFTYSLLKSILQKAIEIEKWAILERGTKPLRKELNFYDILDELRNDGKDGYAKELEKTRDELLGEVQEPPTFTSSQTAFGLFKKLRRIIEDKTDDSKKLLLYADSIEDLIKDDTKLHLLIWRGEFVKVVDIVLAHFVDVDYDLFNELLARISAKNTTAATQLKEKYDKLIILSNVENAREDELKAVESAAFDLVSLMREIAETKPDIPPIEKEKEKVKTIGSVKIQSFTGILGDVQAENLQIGDNAQIHKKPKAETKNKEKRMLQRIYWLFKKIPHWIYALIIFLAALLAIFNYLGWLD